MIITGGWDTLELRLIGKTNICAIDEAAFDEVYRTLQEEQMGGRAATALTLTYLKNIMRCNGLNSFQKQPFRPLHTLVSAHLP